MIVTARQHDTVDLLCWRHLGRTSGGVVEAALTLNQNLAGLGPVLPEGTRLALPEPASLPRVTPANRVQLWT